MPLDPWTLQWVVKPVTREEGLRILGTRPLPLSVLRIGWNGQLRERFGHGSGLRGTAGSQGEEESSQLGGLLSSVQHNKGAPHVWQFRKGESIRARTTRGGAQDVGSQETTS
jgi:hypothetical protein